MEGVSVVVAEPRAVRLVLAGYFAKEILPRPAWLDAPPIEEVCSVSHHISAAPDGWVDHWLHNALGFFDDAERALGVAARLSHARLFAYRVLPARFEKGEEKPWTPPGVDPVPLDDRFVSLGFDPVSRSENVIGFECSPLTCNRLAAEVVVNRYGLVDSLDEAQRLANRFSRGGAEPGPYYVFEVLERRFDRTPLTG